MVVIMMGRKRSRELRWIASPSGASLHGARPEREVDHHDGVLLHDADQSTMPISAMTEFVAEQRQRARSPGHINGRVERIVMGWM